MHSRLRKNPHGWSVKLRTAQGDHWFAIGLDHEAGEQAAEDRRVRLQRLANLLKAAGRGAQTRELILEAAAERAEKDFRKIEVAIEGFTPDAVAAEKGPRTFREVSEYFASGRYQDEHRDSVKKRKEAGSLALSKARLDVFLPVLGTLPFPAITKELLAQAKKRIPDVDVNTRRAYLHELRRILRIAHRPLDLYPAALDVELPPKGPRKVFTFLYPAEEFRLVSCLRLPLQRRFFYAYLARNGERVTEALQITWGHMDLVNGRVRVEAAWTKTGVARFWDLDEDVLEALLILHASAQPKPTDRVFVGGNGQPMKRGTVLYWMRKDLVTAGLERPELHAAGEGEQTLRVHDLGRSTFVTLARAMGRPDRWIMDRTGHDSVSSFEDYDRLTRHARERNLGWLAPMGRALGLAGATSQGPDWARGQAYGVGQTVAKTVKTPRNAPYSPVAHERQPNALTDENPAKTPSPESPETPVGPRGQPGSEVVGQSRGQSAGEDTTVDPVERALAFAITEATRAQRWDVVLACTTELSRRELHRSAPTVTSLADARARKNGDKP